MGMTECKECNQASVEDQLPQPFQLSIRGRSHLISITSYQGEVKTLSMEPNLEIAFPLTQEELVEYEEQLKTPIKQRLQELEPLQIRPLKSYEYSERAYKLKKTQSIYLGQWSNGIPQGFGILINPIENSYYEGSILGGKPHGFGRKIYSQGNYYQGEFEYGKISNQGLVVIRKEKDDTKEQNQIDYQQSISQNMKIDSIQTERSQVMSSIKK
ncbi:unnamed protein product [Paramecium octaurelia]|uniref:MORN repeat-containing protein 3 n=1 Tax=Paramecium octaurelia TaxID=43137 RepID=A0A8S1WCV1_PAROT|nr:unnamed protein product [Paramecium octaurelia]